jgi:hypothetical protein
MPIHDWTRVDAGLFHHFHLRWIAALCDALNSGVLPADYFALAEQVVGGPIPDVLSLRLSPVTPSSGFAPARMAIVTTPPRTRLVQSVEDDPYALKANRIVVRHEYGQVVAVVEIISPGNKSARAHLRAFVEKSAEPIRQGVHLLVIDLFPPNRRHPQGIHKLIWDEFDEQDFELPADKPLTLVSYSAGVIKKAYVEPIAVGDCLPDMPLFLEPETYVPAPLEATYQTTWGTFPAPLKGLLTGEGNGD